MMRLPIITAFILFATSAMAANWPPADPGDYVTKTDFSVAWAKRLRNVHSLEQLQKAAGSNGVISERSLEGNDPYVSFHWRSEPPHKDSIGYMLATVRPDGRLGIGIITTDDKSITLNTDGAFYCDKCTPSISIDPIHW